MLGGGVARGAPLCQTFLTLHSCNSSRVPQGTLKLTICLKITFREIKMHLAGAQNHHRLPAMVMHLWHCQVSFMKSSGTTELISLRHQIKRQVQFGLEILYAIFGCRAP